MAKAKSEPKTEVIKKEELAEEGLEPAAIFSGSPEEQLPEVDLFEKAKNGLTSLDQPDTDEIKFLKRIYEIQNSGCWGTHLNQMINDRIAELKRK